MPNNLLMGIGRHMLPIPALVWKRQVAENARAGAASLAFMSEEHHRVRNFVVLDLPRASHPLSPELIAARLNLPLERVKVILDELERNLTFLFRNPAGEVVWAYPVTVEKTPHRVKLSTGDSVYAA